MTLILILAVLVFAFRLLMKIPAKRTWLWGALFGGWLALLGVAIWLTSRDLYLQKIVSMLIMPAGLLWILLGATAFHAWSGKSRAARWLALAAFVFYSIVGNQWVGTLLIGALEHGIPEFPDDQGPILDAVCVLGGGTKLSPRGVPELGDAGGRVMLAARLFKAGRVKRLVSFGSSIPGMDAPRDLARETADIWADLGVPRDAMRLVPEPKNTSQEIAACRALQQQEGWQRVGLLSSAWHLPRIMRLARRAGLDAVPIPADHRGSLPPISAVYLVPNTTGFENVKLAIWEAIGMLVGR